ncbi:MAG: glycosyltransferase family 4 protein [Vicinamibacterales bacterium]
MPERRMSANGLTRVLAVPPLGDAGGGTGQVGRLLWDVFQRAWPDRSRLAVLTSAPGASPALSAKIAFGSQLIALQALARTQWIAFGHLGLTNIQSFVPQSLRSPYAVFLYGVEAWKPLQPRLRQRLKSATMRVAISAFTARCTADANPDVGEIVVCPLALSPSVQVLPAARPASPAPVVLIVGRMAAGEGYKGHDQLIDAWPHVTASVPGARLVIVGDGDDAPRLRSKAMTCGAGSISFTGFVDRSTLAQLYREAAVFAMPSRGEGFGLVYLEAMAHRLPCIGSVHDAAGEVIENGTTGLLVDLDDSESLGRALVCLLRNADIRARMGQAGFERLQREFTFERFSENVVRLFETHLEPARS